MALLDLFVKIGLVDEVSTQIGRVGKAVTAGVGAATAAIGVLTKAAVSAYGDYEQLAGGVETLFGAGGKSLNEYAKDAGGYTAEIAEKYNSLMDAQTIVFANAAQAYNTAGLSANKYMEQVTSFSAALVSSLGKDSVAAAKYADMAMVDMADNANKMGTAMDSIQNAYQGFAKQNFTMLDNLKLGYGGTKQEMERLLADAQELSGVEYDISSFADMVAAIHVVQEEMGITGTTAKEAATTIQGSVNAMKAAWENWVTGLGDSKADMTQLTEILIQSFETVTHNILPVATNILSALTETLKKDGPTLFGEAFSFISENIPTLVDTGLSLLSGIAEGITENLPTLLSSGIDIAVQIAEGVISGIPELVSKAPQLISELKDAIIDKLPDIKEAGQKIVENLQEALDNAGFDIDLGDVISKFEDLAPAIAAVTAALIAFKAASAIAGVIQGVSGALTAFKAANDATTVSQALLNAVMNANPFVLIATAVAGLVAALVVLWNTNEGFRESVSTAWETIKSTVSTVAESISSAMSAAWETIQGVWSNVSPYFSAIWDGIKSAFSAVSEVLGGFFSAAWDGIQGVWNSVAPYFSTIWESIKNIFSVVSGWLGDIFSAAWSAIQSAWEVAAPFFSAVWDGIKSVFSVVSSWLPGIWSAAWSAIQAVWAAATGFFASIWATISGIFSAVEAVLSGDFEGAWDAIKGIVDQWAGYFGDIWDKIKAVFSNAVSVGTKIVDDIKDGISSAWEGIVSWFQGLWDSVFGGLTVNVKANTSGGEGSGRAIGLDYVPYNGMPAVLHRGEAILTAVEADRWRRGLDRTGNEYAQPVAAPINVYTPSNAEVVDLLSQILDSMGSNLQGKLDQSGSGVSMRDFGRLVRSVI